MGEDEADELYSIFSSVLWPEPSLSAMEGMKSPWSETFFWLLMRMLQSGNHKGDARNRV